MNTHKSIFKKSVLPIICLYFIIGLLTPVRSLSPPPKILRVGVPSSSQLCYSNGINPCEKYSIDYLNKIAQFTGCQYEFVKVEGEAHEVSPLMADLLNSGKIDIIAPMESNPSTQQHADFSGSHYVTAYSTISVLNSNDTADPEDYQSLDGYSIAVLGNDKGRILELERFFTSNNITYTTFECRSMAEALSMLEGGKVDAILSNSTVTPKGTRIVAKFSAMNYYFAVKKGNSELLNELNVAMNNLDKSDPNFATNLSRKYFADTKSALVLTSMERAYISKSPQLTVMLVDGMAPLQYSDKDGKAAGISKLVLDEIAKMTGLKFNYKMVSSIGQDNGQTKVDIFTLVPQGSSSQVYPNMVLSQPYLRVSTIMYMNSKTNPHDLQNSTFAATKGASLPAGINPDNIVYYNNRKEALDAVEKGLADYGYGNAYSVAFYTLQNSYKNIVTIPQEKESREYCFAFTNSEDKLLPSIINKSINAIDESTMQRIIFETTSDVDIKVTSAVIFYNYGEQIVAIFFITVILLTLGIISYVRTNIKLKIQNERYEVLSEISNDYLYEYNMRNNQFNLSEKSRQMFSASGSEEKISNILKDTMLSRQPNDNFTPHPKKPSFDRSGYTYEINLPFEGGEEKMFRATNSCVYDSRGKLECIIGKLTDISREKAEKESLILKAQIDGLTGLYNATTSKGLIIERLNKKQESEIDAFILMDLDLFKDVNDTHGHYTGDKVLQEVARELRATFRSSDIIGRLGGDEFCIYMKNIPSADFLRAKCRELNKLMTKTVGEVTVSASLGIVLVDDPQPYEELFKMADDALYQTKRNTKGRFVIFGTSSAFS